MTIEFICNRNEFFINVKRLVRKDSATLVFLRLMVSLKTMPRKCIIVAHDGKNISSFLDFRRWLRYILSRLQELGLVKSMEDNFIRIAVPMTAHDTTHDVDNVSEHIRTLVACIDGEADRETLQSTLGIKHRTYFRNKYLKPSIDGGYIEFTLPNEKQSKLQKYRLTAKGLALKETLKNSDFDSKNE